MKQEQLGRCEVADCGVELIGESFFDRYFKKTICSSCWEKNFRFAEDNGFGEWFEKNYNESAYPKEFWRKVGAFVDLSKADPGSAYK